MCIKRTHSNVTARARQIGGELVASERCLTEHFGRTELLKRISSSRAKNPIAQQLIAQFKSAIPPNDDVIRQALQDVLEPYAGDVEEIKRSISRVLSDSEARAYQLYKDAQTPALAQALVSCSARSSRMHRSRPKGTWAWLNRQIMPTWSASLLETPKRLTHFSWKCLSRKEISGRNSG